QLGVGFQAQALRGVERDELGELDAVLVLVGGLAVDARQLHQGVELLALVAAVVGVLAFARGADGADDGVALAQVVLLDLVQRDVDVVGPGQVTGGAHERVVLQHVQDAGDGQQDVVLGQLGVVDLGLVAVAAAPVVPVAVALAAVAAAPAVVRVVVALVVPAVVLALVVLLVVPARVVLLVLLVLVAVALAVVVPR